MIGCRRALLRTTVDFKQHAAAKAHGFSKIISGLKERSKHKAKNEIVLSHLHQGMARWRVGRSVNAKTAIGMTSMLRGATEGKGRWGQRNGCVKRIKGSP